MSDIRSGSRESTTASVLADLVAAAAALDIPVVTIGPTRQRSLDRLRASPELANMRE